MSKNNNYAQIDKTIYGRLNDCEAHIYFLECALNEYSKGKAIHYKQIAGELRVLVADKTAKNRLLIELMKDLGIEYRFDYEDKKVTIEEFLDSFGAVLNHTKFSKVKLIREISQNEGSSHESKTLPHHLAVGHSFKVNDIPVHIEQMIIDARYILGASREFIKYMHDSFNYQCEYLESQ